MTINEVREWVSAAKSDGWNIRPTYQTESVEQAATLEKEGFKVMALMRPVGSLMYGTQIRKKDEAEINIWGPDGLAIKPPEPYDFAAIKESVKRCNYCDRENIKTQRVGFAGRCCEDCLPAQRKIHEYDGWTN